MSIAPQKILIIQLRRVGDVLLTTPIPTILKKRFPEAKVDFLVEPSSADVLEGHPDVSEVLLYDRQKPLRSLKEIRSRWYDWVLDFLNNPRSAQIALFSGARVRAGFSVLGWGWVYNVRVSRVRVPQYGVLTKCAILRALGVAVPDEQILPRVWLREENKKLAREWYAEKKMGEREIVIGLIPTHRHPVRRWKGEGFAKVGDLLVQKYACRVVWFWGPGEEDVVKSARSSMKQSSEMIPLVKLKDMAAFLERCNLVVTNDNGPMHLSVAVGVPTVTVYGPTQPECWNPGGEKHRAVQAWGLSCLECNLNSCPYKHECMRWVSAEQVLKECEKILDDRRA